MSAFGDRADIYQGVAKGPLSANSRHQLLAEIRPLIGLLFLYFCRLKFTASVHPVRQRFPQSMKVFRT